MTDVITCAYCSGGIKIKKETVGKCGHGTDDVYYGECDRCDYKTMGFGSVARARLQVAEDMAKVQQEKEDGKFLAIAAIKTTWGYLCRVVKQTHRELGFGPRRSFKFVAKNGFILLSRNQPDFFNGEKHGPNFDPDLGENPRIYARGIYAPGDDKSFLVPLELFPKLREAVAEYNTTFAGKNSTMSIPVEPGVEIIC